MGVSPSGIVNLKVFIEPPCLAGGRRKASVQEVYWTTGQAANGPKPWGQTPQMTRISLKREARRPPSFHNNGKEIKGRDPSPGQEEGFLLWNARKTTGTVRGQASGAAVGQPGSRQEPVVPVLLDEGPCTESICLWRLQC